MFKNTKFILGFLVFCWIGNGRNRPLWTALSLYTHKFIYTDNKPHNYKKVRSMWGRTI